MAPDAPHRRPARPVADAPVDGLLSRTEDLARGWAIGLLLSVPLRDAPGVLTEPFTRDGPRVCDAVLRALCDDLDLRRLQPGGALEPLAGRVGELTGSARAGDASRAVDALHDVLWTALRGELRDPDPDLVSDLAARLTRACACVRAAALARAAAGAQAPGSAVTEEPVVAAEAVRVDAPFVVPPEPAVVPAVEPRAEPTAEPAPSPPAAASPGPVAAAQAGPPPAAAQAGPPPVAPPAGTPLWTGALEDEIRAAGTGAVPLSLLLAEIEDAERVAASLAPERRTDAFEEFTRALRRALRRQDILVQESAARAWVIARDTARSGAHALGGRIAEAVGESPSLGGAPLSVSIGVAIFGEDGTSAEQLIEAAEEARFAASARGIEVSRRLR